MYQFSRRSYKKKKKGKISWHKKVRSRGGGVLPHVTFTGTCGPIGYGFQGVLS